MPVSFFVSFPLAVAIFHNKCIMDLPHQVRYPHAEAAKRSVFMKSFFSGLLAGFGLLLVFGLLASFTMASSITNLFTTLGGLCLIVCPIVGIVNGRKEHTKQRKLKADEQARAERIERELKEALLTMQSTPLNSDENIRRYGVACEDMVYLCAEYMSHPLYGRITKPYRQAIYERTWSVYKWNSRTCKYEYVPGIELADVLHEELDKRIQQFKARHNIT